MSQYQRYNKVSISKVIRYYYWKFRGVSFSGFCHIEKGVKFDRFPSNIYVSKNVTFKAGSIICACNPKARITIGENTTIGYWSLIFASEEIKIGSNCLIAPKAHILDSNHKISRNYFINTQDNSTGKVSIEEDVWLGSNVTVLKSSTIGRGCVVGANSVVKGELDEFAIYSNGNLELVGYRHE